MEFRAEASSLWNHTQFKGDANNGGISTNFGSGNFGAVTNAFDGRQFQLGSEADLLGPLQPFHITPRSHSVRGERGVFLLTVLGVIHLRNSLCLASDRTAVRCLRMDMITCADRSGVSDR